MSKFQFLIGSLEASQGYSLVFQQEKFQFLIGSLEAVRWLVYYVLHEEEFQFLIGSLEACEWGIEIS